MKKSGKIFLFSCFLISFFYSPFLSLARDKGEDIEVLATVDKNKLSLGDRVQVTLAVSSSKSMTLEKPRLPPLQGLFNLLSAWESTKTSSVFIQGAFQTTRTQNFHYLLEPRKKGNLRIESFEVKVGEELFRTKPIEIQVFEEGDPNNQSSAAPSPQSRRDFFDHFGDEEDLFSNFFGGSSSPPKVPSKDDFFIQSFYNKRKVFEGEQLLVSWFIYTREDIGDIDTVSFPSFKGFWKEDITQATQLRFTNEVINGIIYKRAKIATYALFPLSPGKAVIEPYVIKALLVRPSQFFFGRGRSYQVTRSSEPIEIEVLPLPEENKPEGFSKAVGEFSISAELDTEEVSVDQPVSLNIRYQGYGNAKLMDMPSNLTFPDSLEHYDTRKEAQFFKNGKSYKNFELILIPREEGEFEIPSFDLSAFNPETEEYYIKRTPALKIKVLPRKDQSEVTSLPFQRGTLGDDKEALDQEKNKLSPPFLSWNSASIFSRLSFRLTHWILVYSALLFLFAGLKMSQILMRKSEKGFKKILGAHIKRLRLKARKKDFRGVGVYGTNAIYSILGHISGQGGAHLKMDELLDKTPPSLRKKLEKPIKELMKKFEVLSFAPREMLGELKSEGEIKKMIQEIERMLKILNREALSKKESDFLSLKNKKKMFFFLFFFLSFFPSSVFSALTIHSLKLSTQEKWDAPRWMYSEVEKEKMEKVKNQEVKKLYLIKKNLKEKKYDQCLKYVRELEIEILKPWLLDAELECITQEAKKKENLFYLSQLKETLIKFKKESQSFKNQRLPQFFYRKYISSLLSYLEMEKRINSKNQIPWSKNFLNELQALESQMKPFQKAKFFFLLAYSLKKEKRIFAARDFLIKSLQYKNSKPVREELEKILKEIRKTRDLSSQNKQVSVQKKTPKRSFFLKLKKQNKNLKSIQKSLKRENELYSKVQRAFRKRNKIKTIQEGVKLLRGYPWGKHSESTLEMIFKVYLKLTKKPFKKSSIKWKAIQQIEKLNGEMLYSLAFELYKKYLYEEAFLWGEKSFKKLEKRTQTSKVLEVLAKSAFYLGDFLNAELYFKKLFFEYSGTSEAKEALFLLSLIQFRNKNYGQAAVYFKQLTDLKSYDYDLESYYWLWRSLQRLNDIEGSKKVALMLSEKYPLTYYGLRARAFLNRGVFKWEGENEAHSFNLEVRLSMTETQMKAWKRLKLFLLSGWFKEAEEELKVLSSAPQSQQEKIIWAKFLSLAYAHQSATQLLHQAVEEDKNLLKLSFLRYSYPVEFKPLIYRESKKNGLDPLLVQSVIRQESSFQVEAKSSAHAMGLMQLVPITAWEQANLLKQKIYSKKDFYNPSINVRLGTHYLKRMIRAFNGHVPLALAAYNAGIGNIRRWQKNRVDLKNIQLNHSTSFENEVWIDEMPWKETRFYVKAVLRHFLIYKMLERKEMKWKPSFWLEKTKSIL